MAKAELGTKRICPETGRKFYDLNKDPIVSPYTGKSYPLSFFEDVSDMSKDEPEVDDEEAETEGAEVVSLEDADEEASSKGSTDLPDLDDDDDDVDLGDDDNDAFLEDEEEDDDDVSGIINVGDDDEES
ncbi:TIGR02300 family protein [Nitratireductor basaltis]|uniref:TIGR02300 family protein n=1 Tax=Nitratireductor basaltis TaxID=472175 RepID=A0A084U5R4_9HYPH|nr:TIGR02300 family protein [Nitratireductor basaltis]KFB08300.1 hypothetical protein EL18_02550 [Nitratireductor basaltis]